jgi:DNA polymerase-3 subunit alpha
MTGKFVHLHTHSHYSLLDGLAKVDELVEAAKEYGMPAVALTDHGSMYGAIELYQKATKAGLKPIIGCEVYIVDNMLDKRTTRGEKMYNHLTLIAENNTGYKNLVKLATKGHLEGFYYKPRIDKNLLREHSEGLICMSACLGGEVSQAILKKKYDKAKKIALEHQEIFGKNNYFIELQHHPGIEDQNFVTPQLIKLARELKMPMVATQDSHYCHLDDAEAHEVLIAVQTGKEVGKDDAFSFRSDDFSFASPQKMAEKFKDVPEAIKNTVKIAGRCNVELELGVNKLPEYPLPLDLTPDMCLRTLCDIGLKERYDNKVSDQIRERMEYELGVIERMGFASYFLIVQDYVNWAKKSGIIVGPGRGSAAGSLVSYLLRITNLDPIKYGLIFERFLNPERVSMPDIDVDFDDARRDEVFDYVRQKYGKDNFAQIITFGTMAARGSVRDAGRALGFPYELCDKIAKLVPFNPNQGRKKDQLKRAVDEVEELRQLYQTNPDVKKIIDSASKLEGTVRHSSTHACAAVIAPEPLTEYLPLQRGTNGGDIITQYEMHAVEDIGLLKMDFLGLSNLTIIEKTLQLIKQNYDVEIDMDEIPLDDKRAFKVLQEAKTTGVFQLESTGMKRYLKKLKPTCMEDIIVMVSLYRPGPLDAGMVEEYIQRKHGKAAVTYLHPMMKPILSNTYGIIVYQEQLMKIANKLANFTLPQGYMLIKAVGKKIKSLLDEQKGKMIEGMVANQIEEKTANKVWEFIEPFARYGFNKSHAACYAHIGYQTAYLKANYPVEFMAALLNSNVNDIERIAFLIEECKSMDIEVQAPQINESYDGFSVAAPKSKTIRFGLNAIKNVGSNVVKNIIEERSANGSFKDIENFVTRVKSINRKTFESLVRRGALDDFEERGVLIANVDNLMSHAKETQKKSAVGQASLFGGDDSIMAPFNLEEASPMPRPEKLKWEKELLGLYISDHPLKDVQKKLRNKNLLSIADVSKKMNRNIEFVGLVSKIKKIVTKAGQPMLFSTLEDTTSTVEVVVFPSILEQNSKIWEENSILHIKGKMTERNGAQSFLCNDAIQIDSLM